jgi:uncharacterized membrane protein
MFDALFDLLALSGFIIAIIAGQRARAALTELRALKRELAASASPPGAPQQASEPVMSTPPAVPVMAPVVVPVVEPPAPTPAPAAPPVPRVDLESLLTLRWGVWLGAAALVLAGVFLVRYAAEQGLLGPGARCVMAGLLGTALLVAAEWLKRRDKPLTAVGFETDQAPAGLAAGGTAMLFAAWYGAGPFYDLVPPLVAFAGMAVASVIGLGASLRFGPLAAAVGIVGAFATPALAETPTPSLPGLFVYLFAVSLAALLVMRRTAWVWLGWATTIAGALWVCFAVLPNPPDAWAAAIFVPAAVALHLWLLPGEALDHPGGRVLGWAYLLALGVAGLLVEIWIPGAAPRVALFLLSPIAMWKGVTESRLSYLPWLAAGLGLLALLVWALPAWTPTGQVMTLAGTVVAVLPGAWAPEAIRPLLSTAAGFAAFYAGVGLWQERRAMEPLRWAGLVAAVPVLTLAVAYMQVARFQTDTAWAAVALGLMAALTGTAWCATAEAAPGRAGLHAAGAVAALSLGCAMLLRDQWLSLALALLLPGLAWIEGRTGLRALRKVAIALAVVVMLRLLANPWVLAQVFGSDPPHRGLALAYLVSTLSFGLAAWMFRRGGDDRTVAVLEAGAVCFLAVFAALEIRHWDTGAGPARSPGFGEFSAHLLVLAVQAAAYRVAGQRLGRTVLRTASDVLGMLAAILALGLIVLNPAVAGEPAAAVSLAAAYLAPAGIALFIRRSVAGRHMRLLLAGYAVLAGFVWITLQIRQAFHPAAMQFDSAPFEEAELWAWSGAWLGYGILLMALGLRLGHRLLRLTALGMIGLVCLKVFLVDMADLTGLWRVMAFLGLGLALIGLAALHRRFVPPGHQDQHG